MEVDVATIIQGGAVGISLALIWLIGILLNRLFTFLDNHINHNTDAMTELSKVITELKTFLEETNKK